MKAPIPILRSFDETKAREFYVGYLGFAVDWEHRFEPGMPLYFSLSRGACTLHLSEHHGDCSPGAALRIEVDDVDALWAELQTRPRSDTRPGLHDKPWGTREMAITDPFGNRLHFYSEAE